MPRKRVPVIHTDENGNKTEYPSIFAASICTGFSENKIRKCCMDINNKQWQHKNPEKRNYVPKRKVVAADPVTGEIIKTYVSLTECSDTINVNSKTISDCCKFKDRLCKGHVYLFADEYSVYEARYVAMKDATSSSAEKKQKRLSIYTEKKKNKYNK